MKNTILVVLLIAGILLTACPEGAGTDYKGVTEPTNLIVLGATENSITLAWTAVSGAAQYKVYTSVTSTGVYTFVDETAYNTYIVNNLTPNSTFFYKVAAVNNKGIEGPQSVYREGKTIEPHGPLPPRPPTGLTVTAATENNISLEWTAVSDAASYIIYRAVLAASPNYSFVDETEYNTYTNNNLAPNSTYYFKVSAVGINGLEGAKSVYREGKTLQLSITEPQPPSRIVSFDINGGTGVTPADKTADEGSRITLPGGSGFSKPDHTFIGWNDAGTGTAFPASYPVSGDITLYAVWIKTTYRMTRSSEIRNIGDENKPRDETFNPDVPISTLKQFGFTELKIDVLFEYGDQQARLNKNATLRVQLKNYNNTRELGSPAHFGYVKDWTHASNTWRISIDDTNSSTGQFTIIWSRVEIGGIFSWPEEFKVRNRTITVTALK